MRQHGLKSLHHIGRLKAAALREPVEQGVALGQGHGAGMLLKAEHLPAEPRQRQGIGADAAVRIHQQSPRRGQGGLQQGNQPLRLAGVHLEEGVAVDLQHQAREALMQPVAARQGVGLGAEQHVGGPGLQVEGHSHQVGPAGHPGLGLVLHAFEVAVAGDQGDQQLAGVMADPQGQMAQSAPFTAVPVHRPVGGLEIGLERCDQRVKPRIENRTAVHVDDLVGATPVEARPQAPIGGALQRNDRPVAVPELRRGSQQRLQRHIQSTDAQQGLAHQLLLPVLLPLGAERLQAAAAAVVRQDAGGPAALRGGLQEPQQLGAGVTTPAWQQAHLSLITGQTPFHKEHLSAMAGDAPALPVEIGDLHLHTSRLLLMHDTTHFPLA